MEKRELYDNKQRILEIDLKNREGTMKLRYTNKKKCTKQFTGFEAVNCDWLWNETLHKWARNIEEESGYSSQRPCKSVRAFKRMLRSAPNIEFRLWHKYDGFIVKGKGKVCQN